MHRTPASRPWLLALASLVLAGLACQAGTPTVAPSDPSQSPAAGPTASVFDSGRTAFGFFPSPPEASLEAVLNHFNAMGEHGDFVLIQPNIPWEDFRTGIEGESEQRTDLRNQTVLAQQNNLEWIFVVDPLNGLNRKDFFGLPAGWQASFANPDVRAAFTNFTLWIVREFHPRYLGLASEINTYMDAHPDDVQNYLSLYGEVYDLIKAEAPDTQVFVTFQWDDLNNIFAIANEGRPAGQTNWEQVEAFEPRLDLWVISSYPHFAFPNGEGIPTDYYTRLAERTNKPLAVGEGGWSSRPDGPVLGDEQSQVAYLQAIHDQLGEWLSFWVYLILNDFNLDSFAEVMRAEGRPESDIETLSFFAALGLRQFDGTPKPALALWESFRAED